MFIDQLIKKIIEKRNPTVVGLDPQEYLIPQCIIKKYGEEIESIGEVLWQLNKVIIDQIAPLVPAVKLQIAFYERWGIEGLKAYQKTIQYAKEKELIVIGDIKRGDISSTAQAYAIAHLEGPFACDGVTVNPFMGSDSIRPFLDLCKRHEKGSFILTKTSNPSSKEFQNLVVEEKPLYLHIAYKVEEWGKSLIGDYGYSSIGAVVGATHPKEARELRKAMPHTFFLVPGYGAQGARAEDILSCFDERGLGAIVNSSRGIIGAHLKEKGRDISLEYFKNSVRNATEKMQKDLLKGLERNAKYKVY
ncbi:orotidine-5'-phosphate decarboxylase [Garciella nitratireducens]|uniref:Orotidine 5'-phosphate decarboxylase n=1 Tax=Garciella nitratireducens DSM 15102 TaxID=1121911 RepID=A0A1T4N9X2_9FIRM|nr:orotidine-5'-phosphate decarboxylase [Garciella nitratireducens]SJZ76031.1 orotidine-5'-phosphate decarboxylase [Garciella nitratireducens DSM 15102]